MRIPYGKARIEISLRKRHIDVDPDTSVKDLFRLLNVTGDSVTMLVEGEPVQIEVQTDESDHEKRSRAEQCERSKRAVEELRKYVDLDELERNVYSDRENDHLKPLVTFE